MHEVSLRFVDCVNTLKKENKIKSIHQMAKSLDFAPQNLHNIVVKQTRDVPLDLLYKAIAMYNINPEYIMRGTGTLFTDDISIKRVQVLTVVTDNEGGERIVHVPYPAQAGYSGVQADTEFIEALPTYTIPDPLFNHGTFRSFDVKGESMEPTLFERDVVICSFIEMYNWGDDIRDNKVYVIVTHSNVVVKRVINNLRMHRHLELVSDNEEFESYRLNIGEIKEVWEVKKVIKNFDHSAPLKNDASQSQDVIIGKLHDLIGKLQQS